ncbi:MAG TPA: VCBS repeat-containing protein [Cytophagales bacterium]|nr:VCBS repeat-containing protein [Cytophagales bacterium]
MKRLSFSYSIVIIFSLFAFSGCQKTNDKKLFRLLSSEESGVDFKNQLTETVEFNIFKYMYFYNGGGVAIGDVNGDNLPDLYFSSNQESNKLYLNQGNLKFKDITEEAGVEGYKGWTTGVNMADVNGDGKLDIYVCHLGDYEIYKGKNQLFINEGLDENGIPKFADRAMEYGLDLVGFSTQSAFFDYDLDGDLDMYMLNHSVHQNGTFGKASQRYQKHPLAGDKLMRNDEGRFIDVTDSSGIYGSVIGYGLGIAISDINLDGLPDIYIGNDFHENDYLYINQGGGKFKESLESVINHTSRFTMGCDIADFNNDGFVDIASMDMLPEDPKILKASGGEDPYDVFNFKLNYGYAHQYAKNSLQLNLGNGKFSEIGLFAGVAATDWSWSTLFADFDLDGRKDIFISNGIPRRFNDLDYVNFISHDNIQYKLLDENLTDKELALSEKMPKIKLQNYLYHNNGDTTFVNKSLDWGLEQPSYSNGTAYADLDNDGDLDLVINNIEDNAFIYENLKNAEKEGKENGYLKVKLTGNAGNQYAIGAKVFIYQKGKVQMQECLPVRGFQSSIDYPMIFGLGNNSLVDSLIVIWPDASFQLWKNIKGNQTLILKQDTSSAKFDYSIFHKSSPVLKTINIDSIGIHFQHKENKFVEFSREFLLPHMLSAEGPASAVADINSDGLDDIFLGGAKWQSGEIYQQNKEGRFVLTNQPTLWNDSTFEDVDAIFEDVDNDNDVDLVVVSGGNEFKGTSEFLKTRLYLNDGKGYFSRSTHFPDLFITGSSVASCDYDKDGDIDLFIGTRTIPWKYGQRPDSYLLENNGKGIFKDVTSQKAPALQKLGFIKDAIWTDIDNDQYDDLIIAGEWMPITILANDKGNLRPLAVQDNGLDKAYGFWNNIISEDFDGDGDQDFVAGNLGLNSKLKASSEKPVSMYVKDFDNNGSLDQILTYYINGKEYPFHTKDELTKQLPGLKKKYLSYKKFSEASFNDIFSKEDLKGSERFLANSFESAYIENLGNNKFKMIPLPKVVQFSPIMSSVVFDINNDSRPDLITAGNFYPTNIQMGRYDASYGNVLMNNGTGSFKPMSPSESGLSVTGETRAIRPVMINGKKTMLFIRNNDNPLAIQPKSNSFNIVTIN